MPLAPSCPAKPREGGSLHLLIEDPLRSLRSLLIPHRLVHPVTGARILFCLTSPAGRTAALGKQEEGDCLTVPARDLTVQGQRPLGVRHALARPALPKAHLRGQHLGVGV